MSTHLDIFLKDFFAAVIPEGFIECRAIDCAIKRVVGRTFIPAGNMDLVQSFREQHQAVDLYFGVVSRWGNHDGTAKGCGKAFALFVDIDFKDTPETTARTLLMSIPVQPSIVVHSGGGLHCYWLLQEFFNVQSEPKQFKRLLRQLALAVGGDINAAEPARVLRVPQTLNHKYEPVRIVTVERFERDTVYAIDDFDFLPYEVPRQKPESKSESAYWGTKGDHDAIVRRFERYLEKVSGAIQGDAGDTHTYKAACVGIIDFGLMPCDVFNAMWKWNVDHCVPPWSADELQLKIENAARYGAGEIGSKRDAPPPNGSENHKRSSQEKHSTEEHEPRRVDEKPQDGRPTAGATEAENGPLLKIDVTYQDLVNQTKLAWEAILQESQRKPFLFRRGTIVRIEHNEKGVLILREVTLDRMRHGIAPLADWFKPATEKSAGGPALPPMSIVRNLLATPDPPLPALLRIVEAPVFTKRGALQIEPGYNAMGELYYEPAPGLVVPTVPSCPSDQDVVRARELILEMIQDFPFIESAERAHAIALFLLPFVRDLIDGPTPLHLFEKPSPGTGATLLIEALAYVCVGRKPDIMTEGRDEDEWRKRITAKLTAGPTFVLIDNLRRRLDSAAVSAAITASGWEDRRLGQTEMISFPVTCVWVATGNNPALSSEMTRRTIRIRLNAKIDRPWLRDGFKHPELLQWVAEQRGPLIWSALVLGQAWLAAGRPKYCGKKLGGFENWSDVIGGILAVAGIPGFLGNLNNFYEESDEEGEVWRTFMAAWWNKWQNADVTVSNVFEFAENLPLGDGSERSQKTRLGKLLAGARDRQFGAYRLKKGTVLDGSQRWKLEQ